MDTDCLLKEFSATHKRKIQLEEEISKEMTVVQTKYNEKLEHIKKRKIQCEEETQSISNGKINC